ncbi:hypothetical protein [Legionella tunisiensis]|uniref:hypothetical protein n=1 Tax=Legionella tunisiensis TaxID=1034944 RepID=UPI0002F80715|nr:hypothetical protein [Legionella tunisiensis]
MRGLGSQRIFLLHQIVKLVNTRVYTHGAWTLKRMDVPCEEGIKETALDDEELFADYPYDDIHAVRCKK